MSAQRECVHLIPGGKVEAERKLILALFRPRKVEVVNGTFSTTKPVSACYCTATGPFAHYQAKREQ